MSTSAKQLSEKLLEDFNIEDTVENNLGNINFNISEEPSKVLAISNNYSSKNLMALSLLLANNNISSYNPSDIQKVISVIDKLIEIQVNAIISNDKFKELEAEWLKIQDLCSLDYDNIEVALLDVSKEDLHYDLESNLFDISSSEVFKKVYVAEYDQYGGEPYGAILGLHDIKNTEDDIVFLTGMGMLSKNSHAPYISSIGPDFFGLDSYDDINQIKSFEALLDHPRYKKWNEFRQLEESAYIGLTVGDFMLRSPYHYENNPVSYDLMKNFKESVDYESNKNYLWGPSSIQFIKNMMRAYNETGWFQYVRGVENGGYIRNLTSCVYDNNGIQEKKPPLNILLPDYMELSLSNIGLIPLVSEKGTNNACFFSCSSVKKAEEYQDDLDSVDSKLVTNLSYTMSISRIAHYIKTVIRDKIGSVADATMIKANIEEWLSRYTTSSINPNNLTMAKYPFRKTEISVKPIPGKPGWFSCDIDILPHIQFEGMDTTMKISSKLEPELFQ